MFLILGMGLACVSDVSAQEARLDFKEACWFIDELATAVVFVDAEEEPNIVLPDESDEVRFFDASVVALENDKRGKFAAVIEFMPQRTGVRTFPSIRLESGDKSWVSPTRHFAVGEPHETPDMRFEIRVSKERVYEGEPLRLDFVWQCDLPVGQLRDLRLYPDFFNDTSVTVVVPRSAATEKEQFGVPVGGRRVIAKRIKYEGSGETRLGEVSFPIFVQFDEAGVYELSRTRLLCSRLLNKNSQSNQYAAYFNNGLFEAVDRSVLYEKLEAFSKPLELEVLPLPEKGRLESFSGLFDPESITVSVFPDTVEVGQLMEIRVDVVSDACSEMLKLPQLAMQSSLRNRFWVGQEMNEIWRPDGRSFVARARSLTVESNFFPSLSFQVFDPDAGSYKTVKSDVLPLTVNAANGKSYFAIGAIPGAKNGIAASSEGVWHNYEAMMMNDVLNGLLGILADGFLVFILLGPILFVVLMPWVREVRRRERDEIYRRRKAAYKRFKSEAASKGEEVEALRVFIADCYARNASAMTARDAAELLRKSRGEESLIEGVESLIQAVDSKVYDPTGRESPREGDVRKLGDRVFRLLGRGVILLFALGCGMLTDRVAAADWVASEEAFAEALRFSEESLDSSLIESKYVAAALEFEACGEAGIRSGLAWYNAGNAWFKAGEIGRAIANYRQAQSHLPFDDRVAENLEAARALRVDGFSGEISKRDWPRRWLLAALAVSWIIAWGLALFWVRYRKAALAVSAGAVLALSIYLAGTVYWRATNGNEAGVLIVDEAYGRKGPSYSYLSAYVDALHNGLEVVVLESRESWVRVRLEEGSSCWLPEETVQVLAR